MEVSFCYSLGSKLSTSIPVLWFVPVAGSPQPLDISPFKSQLMPIIKGAATTYSRAPTWSVYFLLLEAEKPTVETQI